MDYTGIYRGVVQDNKDPKNLNRLKVSVPQLTENQTTDWIYPVISTSRPPKIGAGVFVFYTAGNPDYPVWIGEFGEVGKIQGLFNYGSWFDTTTQTITAGQTKTITVNTTDISEGIKVVGGSKFTVDSSGSYNLQFSIQLFRDSGGGSGNTVQLWLAKNGTAVSNSNTKVVVTTNAPYQVAAWNFFSKLKKNDYLELKWTSDTSSMKIAAVSASGGIPAIPSVIVTMNQIT